MEARRRFEDAIPDALIELTKLIAAPDTPVAVRVQLVNSLDRLLALLPAAKDDVQGPDVMEQARQLLKEVLEDERQVEADH